MTIVTTVVLSLLAAESVLNKLAVEELTGLTCCGVLINSGSVNAVEG
jgi:hypothetical protein